MKIKKFKNYGDNYSENLKYHLDKNISIVNNIFRHGSKAYFDLLEEARRFYDSGELILEGEDKELFDETDIGKTEFLDDKMIHLDIPEMEEEADFIEENVIEKFEDFLNESEYKGKTVELNKPKRNTGSGKKYYVYVKNPKTGNVKKVTFGDKKGGLTIKASSPSRKKSFAARHKCSEKTDKTTAGYWACRANKFFGSGKSTKGYW